MRTAGGFASVQNIKPTGNPNPPPNKAEIVAARQNHLALNVNEIVDIIPGEADPGEITYFRLANYGPGEIFARWDGTTTKPWDPAAICLPAGTAYQDAAGFKLSVACGANADALISFTAESG